MGNWTRIRAWGSSGPRSNTSESCRCLFRPKARTPIPAIRLLVLLCGFALIAAPAQEKKLPAVPDDSADSIAAPQAVPPPSPAAPAQPAAPATTPVTPEKPRFVVVIDPGHGGEDRGAALGDISEKDFTLAFARRLRVELDGRGIDVVLLRDGDNALTLDQRALAAANAHANVYLAVHAAVSGIGVRVYTSDLPSAGRPGAILPWATAQSAYVVASNSVALGITQELVKRQVAAVEAAAPVRPLNNIGAAAVALELAPPREGDIAQLTSAAYQDAVSGAIGNVLVALRGRLGAAR